MTTSGKNLSSIHKLPDGNGMRIGIVVSSWNSEITEAMYQGAFDTLIKSGVKKEDITRKDVPGSFELPLGAKYFLTTEKIDAIICIGCVIQGETKHFDFICQAVSTGIMQLGLEYNKPVVFGVLTTNNQQQAVDRSGGKHGNKGIEAAVAAIEMVLLKKSF